VSSALTGTAADAVVKKSEVIQQVTQDIVYLDAEKIDLNTMVVLVSDGDQNLTTAVENTKDSAAADVYKDDVNATEQQEIEQRAKDTDQYIDEANNAVDAAPAKLDIGSALSFGTETVVITDGKFVHTLNTKDKNITDFYNITLSSMTSTKDINISDVNLTIEIQSENDETVTLDIKNVELNFLGTKLTTIMPEGTTIVVGQTNLPTLADVIGDEATGTTSSELVNTDLSVNIQTILDTLGSSEIPNAINVLDKYLQQPGVYSVSIKLSVPDTVVIDNSESTGTITVINQ
jgi:hypothetical protein